MSPTFEQLVQQAQQAQRANLPQEDTLTTAPANEEETFVSLMRKAQQEDYPIPPGNLPPNYIEDTLAKQRAEPFRLSQFLGMKDEPLFDTGVDPVNAAFDIAGGVLPATIGGITNSIVRAGQGLGEEWKRIYNEPEADKNTRIPLSENLPLNLNTRFNRYAFSPITALARYAKEKPLEAGTEAATGAALAAGQPTIAATIPTAIELARQVITGEDKQTPQRFITDYLTNVLSFKGLDALSKGAERTPVDKVVTPEGTSTIPAQDSLFQKKKAELNKDIAQNANDRLAQTYADYPGMSPLEKQSTLEIFGGTGGYTPESKALVASGKLRPGDPNLIKSIGIESNPELTNSFVRASKQGEFQGGSFQAVADDIKTKIGASSKPGEPRTEGTYHKKLVQDAEEIAGMQRANAPHPELKPGEDVPMLSTAEKDAKVTTVKELMDEVDNLLAEQRAKHVGAKDEPFDKMEAEAAKIKEGMVGGKEGEFAENSLISPEMQQYYYDTAKLLVETDSKITSIEKIKPDPSWSSPKKAEFELNQNNTLNELKARRRDLIRKTSKEYLASRSRVYADKIQSFKRSERNVATELEMDSNPASVRGFQQRVIQKLQDILYRESKFPDINSASQKFKEFNDTVSDLISLRPVFERAATQAIPRVNPRRWWNLFEKGSHLVSNSVPGAVTRYGINVGKEGAVGETLGATDLWKQGRIMNDLDNIGRQSSMIDPNTGRPVAYTPPVPAEGLGMDSSNQFFGSKNFGLGGSGTLPMEISNLPTRAQQAALMAAQGAGGLMNVIPGGGAMAAGAGAANSILQPGLMSAISMTPPTPAPKPPRDEKGFNANLASIDNAINDPNDKLRLTNVLQSKDPIERDRFMSYALEKYPALHQLFEPSKTSDPNSFNGYTNNEQEKFNKQEEIKQKTTSYLMSPLDAFKQRKEIIKGYLDVA